ncbi:hypothetical protein PENSPDRAFT_751685 [Peniophora sp. CONT]|nr:hypothetical protein PENSPDRAFT_751685 [Peniophora sp. CONT]
MPGSQIGRAIICIANEHAGDTILGATFRSEVAGDRAIRVVFDLASGADIQLLPIDLLVCISYWRPGATGAGMPTGAIAFEALKGNDIHPSDIVATQPDGLHNTRRCWCVLDMRVTEPVRIIPATLLVPYVQQPSRCNAELEKTDMLPLWFWQVNGSLGVPIIADGFTCLPETPSRVKASSLKVGFWWRNYGPLEKQVQLRIKSAQPNTPITTRRLAKTIAGAVQNAMNAYEESSINRTDWYDQRYIIGTGAGHISVRDVILLGFIFVSPGRIMPLLQLRPDFGVFAVFAM